MAKTTSMILGLAFLALGILGITDIVPMFASDSIYVNIGEIVLGSLGLLIGVYARQSRIFSQQTKDLSHHSDDITDLQKKEIDHLKKLLEQQQEENEDLQKQEAERMEKLLEQQQEENEDLQKQETERMEKLLEQQKQEIERLRERKA